MKRIVFVAAMLVAMATSISTPARANITGNDWLEMCEEDDATCALYARGVAEGLQMWSVFSPKTAIACIPDGVSANQIMEIGRRFVTNSSPEDRNHLIAVILFARAFREKWPCKK